MPACLLKFAQHLHYHDSEASRSQLLFAAQNQQEELATKTPATPQHLPLQESELSLVSEVNHANDLVTRTTTSHLFGRSSSRSPTRERLLQHVPDDDDKNGSYHSSGVEEEERDGDASISMKTEDEDISDDEEDMVEDEAILMPDDDTLLADEEAEGAVA